MAKLIKCPVCGRDVSSGAASCPNCGEVIHRQHAPNSFNLADPVHLIGVLALIILAIFIIAAACS